MHADWLWEGDANVPKPTKRGWYATTLCWDLDEGFYPSATFWDGYWVGHNAGSISLRSKDPFESEKEALQWAYDYDIEN